MPPRSATDFPHGTADEVELFLQWLNHLRGSVRMAGSGIPDHHSLTAGPTPIDTGAASSAAAGKLVA